MIPRRRAHAEAGEFSWLRDHAGDSDSKAVEFLERAIAEFIGVPRAAAVSSGRRAMDLIFKSFNFERGSEAIIPAYTLGALLPFLDGLGLTPVPADIDLDTFNLKPDSVQDRITPRTKAVLALHAFGAPCEIEELSKICRKRGLALIEDCAHGLGATAEGRAAGAFGDAAFFSFETTKPINAYGGGMAVSGNEKMIQFIREQNENSARDSTSVLKKAKAARTEGLLFSTGLAFPALYLLASPFYSKVMARLYRKIQTVPRGDLAFLPVQARIGLQKLESLDQRITERRRIARLYRAQLKREIKTQKVREADKSTWYFMVAILPCPAAPIRRKLLMKGIDAGVGDEIADDCASLLDYSDCPNARHVFERAIALPMYDGITDADVKKVAAAVNGLM